MSVVMLAVFLPFAACQSPGPEKLVPDGAYVAAEVWLKGEYAKEQKASDLKLNEAKNAIRLKGYTTETMADLKAAQRSVRYAASATVGRLSGKAYLVSETKVADEPYRSRSAVAGERMAGGQLLSWHYAEKVSLPNQVGGDDGGTTTFRLNEQGKVILLGVAEIKPGTVVPLIGFYHVKQWIKVGKEDVPIIVPMSISLTDPPKP